MNHPLPTIGEIARESGAARHRVEYVVKLLKVKPIAMVGGTRVFADSDAARMQAELRRIRESIRHRSVGRVIC